MKSEAFNRVNKIGSSRIDDHSFGDLDKFRLFGIVISSVRGSVIGSPIAFVLV